MINEFMCHKHLAVHSPVFRLFCFSLSISSCPSARVNNSYVNASVKGSISAAGRKWNHQGFF